MVLRWNTETDPRLPGWVNALTNMPPLLLPMQTILPVLIITAGFKRAGSWVWFDLRRTQSPQMFRNGMVCLRLMLPIWIGLQIRWSGDPLSARAYLQTGIGWKLNGRFAITLRVEGDAAAAAGVLAPNTDQAAGWNEGGK